MPTDKQQIVNIDNDKPSDVKVKVKDNRTPIAFDKAEEVRLSLGDEKFNELFRVTNINALSIFSKMYPDHPLAKAVKEMGTNQVDCRINKEDWVIRVNGARVKK